MKYKMTYIKKERAIKKRICFNCKNIILPTQVCFKIGNGTGYPNSICSWCLHQIIIMEI